MLLTWKLKQIRLMNQKKLNETNSHLYKCITTYIQNSNLSGFEKEEALQQVLDMMLQAQIGNKSMSLIVGNDYEKFCKSIIEEYSIDKSKTYIIVNYVQKFFIWLTVISFLFMIVHGLLNGSAQFDITVGQIIIATVMSLIIIPISKTRRQEDSSFITLKQRFYAMSRPINKTVATGFLLSLIAFGLLRFLFGKVFGVSIFDYSITLLACVPYLIFILLIISILQIFKRVYVKG